MCERKAFEALTAPKTEASSEKVMAVVKVSRP